MRVNAHGGRVGLLHDHLHSMHAHTGTKQDVTLQLQLTLAENKISQTTEQPAQEGESGTSGAMKPRLPMMPYHERLTDHQNAQGIDHRT